jgi:hypothetical protein
MVRFIPADELKRGPILLLIKTLMIHVVMSGFFKCILSALQVHRQPAIEQRTFTNRGTGQVVGWNHFGGSTDQVDCN